MKKRNRNTFYSRIFQLEAIIFNIKTIMVEIVLLAFSHQLFIEKAFLQALLKDTK